MQRASWKQRAFGAALAFSVQTGFLLLVLLSPSHRPRLTDLPHETILLLPPLAVPALLTIDARGPNKKRAAAPSLTPVSPPIAAPPATSAPLAPPSGLAGFGRALFGCAPEQYASLTPEQRNHCPKPGEGLAKNDDRDLITPPRSHAKYEALWEEEYREAHWMATPCLPDPAGMAVCLLRQSIDENRREEAAREKVADDRAAAPAIKPPTPPVSVRSQRN